MGFLPADALGSPSGSAYGATFSTESLPSSATYGACYPATGPPRFARSTTTCSSCLPLFRGHISSLTDQSGPVSLGKGHKVFNSLPCYRLRHSLRNRPCCRKNHRQSFAVEALYPY